MDAFSAALGSSLGALLLPALVAMSQPQLAPPILPAPPPPPAPPPLLQALSSLGALGNADMLRACLSGLLQHALQAPQAPPPVQAPVSMDLVRLLLSAQQRQPPAAAPAAGGAGASSAQLPLAWRTG